jgi:DNA sulfur modification protein DndD
MKISRLILHNFGIYANTNTLELASEKPVILIGGMNGRGKTTLLEAILLALYGRRSFAVTDSKLSFPHYLARSVNKADGSLETFIELMFDLSSDEGTDNYSVKRLWSLQTAIPALKTIVQKNGLYDQILSDNWDLFVEEMIPSAIAPFFFFDGEKIAELATSDNESQMKNSIKNLLGINVIDQSITDIRKIIMSKKYTMKTDTHAIEIAEYEEKVKKAEIEVREANSEVGLLEIKKSRLSEKLNDAENAFAAMGGSLASNRVDIVLRQSVIQEKLEEVNSQILELASGDLPLLMTLPLMKDMFIVSEAEKDQKAIQIALEQLPALYSEFDKGRGHDIVFKEFFDFVKSNTKELETVYNLSESGFYQLQALCSTFLTLHRENAIRLLKQRQRLLAEKDEIENYLSIDVDEDATTKKYDEILGLTTELATVNEQLRLAQKLADSKKTTVEELKHQQLKVIEKAVSSIEDSTDTKRIITYAGYSINLLQAYKIRLQESKTEILAQTITDCFKKIATKQNLISEIKIEPVTLSFIYLDSEGVPIDRSSFSAGEKQLLVISMLWALGICSKKKLPVIIDTPLARLDSAHRETLITNYFPKASDQTILLSTDSEVYGNYYDLIRAYVEKEYTLVYNDVTKQTTVHKGYFGDECI